MKHYNECPGSYHCVCTIIAERNRYRVALKKVVKLRLEMKSVPFPDYMASLVSIVTTALKV